MPTRPLICLIGLGNPGDKYRQTRHNIGFEWLDRALESLSREASVAPWTEKYDSLFTSFDLDDKEVHCLKPQTFMNLSGKALMKWRKSHMRYEKMVVIYDDLDTELGRVKLRKQGGAAGHNGLLSIFETLGSQDVPRLKLGIGRPPAGTDGGDFVLKKFRPDEKDRIAHFLDVSSEHLKKIVSSDTLDQAMNAINSWRPPLQDDE